MIVPAEDYKHNPESEIESFLNDQWERQKRSRSNSAQRFEPPRKKKRSNSSDADGRNYSPEVEILPESIVIDDPQVSPQPESASRKSSKSKLKIVPLDDPSSGIKQQQKESRSKSKSKSRRRRTSSSSDEKQRKESSDGQKNGQIIDSQRIDDLRKKALASMRKRKEKKESDEDVQIISGPSKPTSSKKRNKETKQPKKPSPQYKQTEIPIKASRSILVAQKQYEIDLINEQLQAELAAIINCECEIMSLETKRIKHCRKQRALQFKAEKLNKEYDALFDDDRVP